MPVASKHTSPRPSSDSQQLKLFLAPRQLLKLPPADESPPLPSHPPYPRSVRAHVEQTPVNHVLIQLYRTGADYISEHSDKTIDVVRGSRIVNVSFGAWRIMTLRTKKDIIAAGGEQVPMGNVLPTVTVARRCSAQRSAFRFRITLSSSWPLRRTPVGRTAYTRTRGQRTSRVQQNAAHGSA